MQIHIIWVQTPLSTHIIHKLRNVSTKNLIIIISSKKCKNQNTLVFSMHLNLPSSVRLFSSSSPSLFLTLSNTLMVLLMNKWSKLWFLSVNCSFSPGVTLFLPALTLMAPAIFLQMIMLYKRVIESYYNSSYLKGFPKFGDSSDPCVWSLAPLVLLLEYLSLLVSPCCHWEDTQCPPLLTLQCHFLQYLEWRLRLL